mmetsp:Transcript_21770/g.40779  ORF Transcript_21770/g.40779 Transcript_21770/m.40779 type:complete len:221 (-) Transcript_21770:357-1019(-)
MLPYLHLGELIVVGFVAVVAILTLSFISITLTNIHSNVNVKNGTQKQKNLLGMLDSVLLGNMSMFLFVAWFFEPSVVYLCGWEGLVTQECQATTIGWLWHYYASTFDPVFLNLPLWLRIVCSLDTLLFGPFYLISIVAFVTGQADTKWYRFVALPFSGMLIYSTIIYFAYECIAEAHRASLVWVFLINLPWTMAPVLLIARLMLVGPSSSPPATGKDKVR